MDVQHARLPQMKNTPCMRVRAEQRGERIKIED